MWQRKHWVVFVTLLLVAVCFRISVAHWLANDNPDDGRVYAQIARNVLEQHVYSQDAEPPYEPTLIRIPGYPLCLAAVYSVFGHSNNGAVRIVQALIDTGTCVLVALLAFLWQPDERRKMATALIALGVAAVNPFTTIYSATILPEVPAMLFAVASCVMASMALRSNDHKYRIGFWCTAGLSLGMAVLFRPDIGLVAAAIGVTLLAANGRPFWSAVASARHRLGSNDALTESNMPKRRRHSALSASSKNIVVKVAISGAVFSLSFALVLLPWTIRNWRTFHLFQPLAPAHAEMPNEFIPHGYNRWLKTWLDDPQYILPLEWQLNVEPIDVDDLPVSAFDSDEEHDRVVALVEKYNHPPGQMAANPSNQPQSQSSPAPEMSSIPKDKSPPPAASPTQQTSPSTNSNSNVNQAENSGGQNDNNNDEGDENEETDNESNEPNAPHGPVEMTPEIDAGFAQIAAERIARHPFRYYVLLPAKRARALWFNTHSDFYPFEGTLLPLDDLDYEIHQQIWLPLFALLVAIYTIAGIGGGFVLWASRDLYARLWLLLVGLIVLLRLSFLSTLENPEPRYVVEFFPFLAALSGIAVALLFKRKTDSSERTAQAS